MRVYALILFLFLCFASCKSSKHTRVSTKKDTSIISSERKLTATIIENAQDYKGVRYKFGGTTKKGMDCSGLIYVAFKKENILLPRISRDMAKKGKPIDLKKVEKGDLLFFKTSKTRNRINHVGLVTKSQNGLIEFIHATTSKGVITSNLNEHYWNTAFTEARRIL